MDHLARLLHSISRKFLKKRRQSIDGLKGPFNRSVPPPKFSKDEDDEHDTTPPPLSPTHTRAVNFLRASTPVKAPGILVHQGSADSSDEDEVSQGEDCIDWNRSVHEIHVDTLEEFVINGGEESPSIFFEEDDGEFNGKEAKNVEEFSFDEEYNEDGFNSINEQQSTFPIQRLVTNGCFFNPNVIVCDDEEYEWDEPMGYSKPSLAFTVPANLASPHLCSNNEQEIRGVARTLMEEESNVLEQKNGRMLNSTYTFDSAVTISPSARPDTPTTNEEEKESSIVNGWNGVVNISSSSSNNPSFRPIHPSSALNENNEWLRSIYEKSGLEREIPDWMNVDPPKKESNHEESPMIVKCKMEERGGFTTSTPVFCMPSPAFSSISTIAAAHLNDSSRTFNSPGLNFTLDLAVRTRVILSQTTDRQYNILSAKDREELETFAREDYE